MGKKADRQAARIAAARARDAAQPKANGFPDQPPEEAFWGTDRGFDMAAEKGERYIPIEQPNPQVAVGLKAIYTGHSGLYKQMDLRSMVVTPREITTMGRDWALDLLVEMYEEEDDDQKGPVYQELWEKIQGTPADQMPVLVLATEGVTVWRLRKSDLADISCWDLPLAA